MWNLELQQSKFSYRRQRIKKRAIIKMSYEKTAVNKLGRLANRGPLHRFYTLLYFFYQASYSIILISSPKPHINYFICAFPASSFLPHTLSLTYAHRNIRLLNSAYDYQYVPRPPCLLRRPRAPISCRPAYARLYSRLSEPDCRP